MKKRTNELEILITRNKNVLKWASIYNYRKIEDAINILERELAALKPKIQKKKETLKKT